MARHIEASLGLGSGWMDKESWPFKTITEEEILKLSELDLARLEVAITLAADKIGLFIGNNRSKRLG